MSKKLKLSLIRLDWTHRYGTCIWTASIYSQSVRKLDGKLEIAYSKSLPLDLNKIATALLAKSN